MSITSRLNTSKTCAQWRVGACLVGRPYLYGLAAGGEADVTRALEIFRTELERDMALMGITRIAGITPDCVRRR